MWIGVLWAGLRVAMWITHVGGGKFRHGLLEKSLISLSSLCHLPSCPFPHAKTKTPQSRKLTNSLSDAPPR